SYGELAAMMPRAGGQYVYLREALGPLWGFLYGWTLFLVIQTGTIAAVGVAFGKFLGVFFPSISSSAWILHLAKVPPIHIGPMVLGNMDVGLNTQNLIAILVVVVLSVINIFGVRTGALIQNIFTSAKVAALLGLALFGLFRGRNALALAANFHGHFWDNAGLDTLHDIGGGVLVGTILERGIKYAAEDRVGTAVMTQMLGALGGSLMAIAILLSSFGCANGLILSGARVYYAMAKDGLFFRSVAKLHPTYKTPVTSLMVQMVWTC